MKLHLPNKLRKMVMACSIIATSTSAAAVEWDAAWGDELKKAPADVKELEINSSSYYELSDAEYAEYHHFEGDNTYTMSADFKSSLDINTVLLGGLISWSNEGVESWIGKRRDVWMNVAQGNCGYIVGGDFNTRKADVNLEFTGNTHLQIGEDATAYFIIGGNMGNYASSATFVGDSYISVYSNGGAFIVGGSMSQKDLDRIDVVGETTDGAFIGNSHVYIYNIRKAYIPEGYEVDDDEDEDEYYKLTRWWAYASNYNVANHVTGGNYLMSSNAGGSFEFRGNSSVIVNLKERSGDFGQRLIGGDSCLYVFSHAHHEGNTEVVIKNAADINFTDRVVGGSLNYWIGASANLHGETHVTIYSGNFRHLVIGGMSSGELLRNDNSSAGRSILRGKTHLTINDGSFWGYEYLFTGTAKKEYEGRGIGSVAVVGGNYVSGKIETEACSVIVGDTDTIIHNGLFGGHVIGGTVVMGEVEDFTGVAIHIEGLSRFTMTGGEMVEASLDGSLCNGTPRVVGGMMLYTTDSFLYTTDWDQENELLHGDMWRSSYRDYYLAYCSEISSHTCLKKADDYEEVAGITLGDVEVNVRGEAKVYDVVGGSWVACEEAPGQVVEQGNLTVNLGTGATVRGNVYAAGIQAGEVALTAESTAVNIEAGVTFAREDTAPTVVSGGFLCADQQEKELHQDVWDSWRQQASVVKGARTLGFTSAVDYGDGLADVIFTNFDEVKVVSGGSVQIGALLLTDTQDGTREKVLLSGGGCLSVVPGEISITELVQAENGSFAEVERVLPNVVPVYATGVGTTLRLAPAATALYTTVQAAGAEKGAVLMVDLAPADLSRRELHVSDALSIVDGGELDLHIHVKADMVSGETCSILKEGRSESATVLFDHALVSLTIHQMDEVLVDERGQILIVLVDKVAGAEEGTDYVLTDRTKETLAKWFAEDEKARVWVDEDDRLVLTVSEPDAPSEPVTPEVPEEPEEPEEYFPGYHEKRAQTENGRSGGRLLDEYFPTPSPSSPDREKVLDSVFENNVAHHRAESDRIQAAVAGASIATLGAALADDVERQLRLMRNRVQDAGERVFAPEASEASRPYAWVNAEGDHRSICGEGTDPGYKLTSWGGTLGVAYGTRRGVDFGVALTAMYGDLRSDGPDALKVDTDTYYFSGFAQVKRGKWSHSFVATAGRSYMEGVRSVDYGTGSYSTDFVTSAHLFGLFYELGRSFALNAEHTSFVEPVFNASWRHVEVAGFTEEGSDAALRADDHSLDSFALGAGLRVKGLVGRRSLARPLRMEGRALAKFYAGDVQNMVEVGFADRSRRTMIQSRAYERVGVELGGSASLPLRSQADKQRSLFLDANAELRGDYANLNATLGYKVQF